MINVKKYTKNHYPWLYTLIGALFFFYANMQFHIFPIIFHQVSEAFNVNPNNLLIIYLSFFYAGLFFMIPAGLVVDKFNVKSAMIFSLILAIFGTLMFAYTMDMTVAAVGRFLTGIIYSFALVSAIKIASLWIPLKSFGKAISLIFAFGILGKFCIGFFTSHIISMFNWNSTLLFLAFLGAFLLFVLAIGLNISKQKKYISQVATENIFFSIKEVLKKEQNWISIFFILFLNLPLTLINEPMLMRLYNFNFSMSLSLINAISYGFFVGILFFGIFSDSLKKTRRMKLSACILCLAFFILAFYLPPKVFALNYIFFFGIGFFAAIQILAYVDIVKNNPQKYIGTIIGITVFLVYICAKLLMPIFVEWFLAYHGSEVMNNTLQFSKNGIITIISIIPFAVILSVVLTFFMKEKRIKRI